MRQRRRLLAALGAFVLPCTSFAQQPAGKVHHLGFLEVGPAIDDLVRVRYAAMSGSERALIALQMFETAQRIVLSSLPPGLSERARRRELCRRFYGDELARRAFP